MTKGGLTIAGVAIAIIGSGLFNARSHVVLRPDSAGCGASSSLPRPLVFVPSHSPLSPDVRFVADVPDCAVVLADSEARIAAADGPSAPLAMQPIGARPHVVPIGEDPIGPDVTSLLGRQSLDTAARVAGFRRARYHDIYDGIDLIFQGSTGALEYGFIVGPGAKPEQIRLRMHGADSVEVDEWGGLLVRRGALELHHRKPIVYQQTQRGRIDINGEYRLGPGRDVRFAVGKYDRSRPLVIDPVSPFAIRSR